MILITYFEPLLLKFSKTKYILKLYFFIWSTIMIPKIFYKSENYYS